MRVKSIFSARKTKKKKTTQQQASCASEVGEAEGNNTDKLIIPTDSVDGITSGKARDVIPCNLTTARGAQKDSIWNEEEASIDLDEVKARTSSTSSNNSAKLKSRRPWSFIEQLRRQDSRESAYSTGSSARTSQVVEDLLESTPPPRYEAVLRERDEAATHSRSIYGACTLPRSLTSEEVERASKTVTQRQDNSSKRRTMDFRFFNFFKRSSSGDSSAYSDNRVSSASSGRSSFRSKNRDKKKGGSRKKRDAEEEPTTIVNSDNGHPNLSRLRSFSDGGETSPTILFDEDLLQVPPPGLYDSVPKLNRLEGCHDQSPEKAADKRVPVNGEPVAFYFVDDDDDAAQSSKAGSSPANVASGSKTGSWKYQRRSDPTANRSLKIQKSDRNVLRPISDLTGSLPRRSSLVCEPGNSSLAEDCVASFDSSTCLAANARMLHPGRSFPQLLDAVSNQKICRALSNDIPKLHLGLSAQARCSQSVSNLATGVCHSSNLYVPKSTSDIDQPRMGRKMPQPSPHQQKKDKRSSTLRPVGTRTSSDFTPPPSPVLRAIGYPGVVLRRKKDRLDDKPRPNSAYADQRTKHVVSLDVEDLPTYYSQMRFDMAKVKAFPSEEDILAVREHGSGTKRGSSGARASTASGRARRQRGGTLSNYGQRVSAGFSTAASVEDLDSLSGSNFGSKQSLSDLSREMDDDEMLNAILAKAHTATHTSSGSLRSQEPSSKRAKPVRKSVVSLAIANFISPGKPNQKGKLQRSSSFKESGSSAPSSNAAATYSFKPYRPPSNTPCKKKNRRSKLWCETFDHTGLNEAEIKWQEAIFELYQGERDLVQDLTMAKQTYRDSMVTLKMLSDEEVALIFGKLDCLLPLHEELLAKLERARGEDGRTLAIGYIGVEWFPQISTAYRAYCANQSDAKYALDAAVERDARVRDFLQRCLESPFSRKLDLWSYLDLPRTRLVKYPLLLQNVLKRTPSRLQEERENLSRVVEIVGEIIERVDETTGEQQCRYVRSKLEYLDDKQRSPFVDNSRLMLCSGQLKNNRGTKMHVFLFEEAFLLTRQTTRGNKVSYQVYRQPLPLRSLVVDTNEGEKLSGSFRGGILSSEKARHSFRVKSEELNVAYTLQASEEHDRKQWINAIQDALAKHKSKHPEAPDAHPQLSRRRATCDPVAWKKRNARAVLRSSSDKSDLSVASSTTDRSSTLEESQDEMSTEDTAPWRRTRSQTINPSLFASKSSSSVSRNSSGSSTKSDRSGEGRRDADVKRLKERLRRLESEKGGPPTSLRDSFRSKKSLISRHFSLGKADKAHHRPTVLIKGGGGGGGGDDDDDKRARNKCQRSRSLTSSPHTVKPAGAMPYGSERLGHGKLLQTLPTNNLTVPNAAKPPLGPTPSPLSLRRTPSLLANSGTLHAAQSTPDLTVIGGRCTSFSGARRASMRGTSRLTAQSSSVDNLRKGLATVSSASDLGSAGVVVEKRAEEAQSLRRERSNAMTLSESDVEHEVSSLNQENPASSEPVGSTDDVPMRVVPTEEPVSSSDDVTDVKPSHDVDADSQRTTGVKPDCDVIAESVEDVMAEFLVSVPSQSESSSVQNVEGDLMCFGDEDERVSKNADKIDDAPDDFLKKDVDATAHLSREVVPMELAQDVAPSEELAPEIKETMDVQDAANQNDDTRCDEEEASPRESIGSVLIEVDNDGNVQASDRATDMSTDAQTYSSAPVKGSKPTCCRNDVTDENSNNGQLNMQTSA